MRINILPKYATSSNFKLGQKKKKIGFAEQEIICTSGTWCFHDNVFDVSQTMVWNTADLVWSNVPHPFTHLWQWKLRKCAFAMVQNYLLNNKSPLSVTSFILILSKAVNGASHIRSEFQHSSSLSSWLNLEGKKSIIIEGRHRHCHWICELTSPRNS